MELGYNSRICYKIYYSDEYDPTNIKCLNYSHAKFALVSFKDLKNKYDNVWIVTESIYSREISSDDLEWFEMVEQIYKYNGGHGDV